MRPTELHPRALEEVRPESASRAEGGVPYPVPEQGQLVEVRRRQFVVAEVARSALPTDGRPPHHLVTLTSIEDDALGEQVRVVWEIEPGARILERAGVPSPDGFDDPQRLEAFLYAVRWGAVTDADYQALQSPFRSGITIEDYQLDPVVRAIQMPRANLLIADDVGLGKTIEAGLVIQELILRHRARTVLVVCPASLQIKWRDEMRDKFGLEFRIVDTDLLKELRRSRGIHVNPWTHFPRLIASIDWLKRDIPMRMLRDALPPHPTYPRPFDILVVDEAHNVAPTGSANYVLDSQRTQAVRTLAPHFEHRLFLTATPHNGYQISFTSLLELLDHQRFARGIPPDQEQLAQVMVRRMKGDIVDWKGEPKFPRREIVPIEVHYTDEERRIHRALVEYSQLRQEAAKGEGDRYATEFVLKLLKKRLFSSPAAFAQTLEKHSRSLTEGSKRAERGRQAVRILRRAIGETEEEYADDTRFEDSLSEAVQTAGSLVEKLSLRELDLLGEMRAWAERARSRPDSKVEALFEWLEDSIRPNGEWSDRRVIVFTEYRATQNYLVEMLTAHGFGDPDRLMTMYGGMDEDQREQIKAAFQASPWESGVRILVATDAASEGIDLQNHCNLMIHAEIPWNPNRLEQRNGRIDRHGQREREVLIHHFVGAGYSDLPDDAEIPVGDLEADLEFLMHAVRKVERIREDLGRVGVVIAEQVEQAMLGRRRRLDTEPAESQAKAARRVLAIEKRIREQIERLHERLLESRKRLQLTPENVRRVVQVGLEIAGQLPLQRVNLPGLDPKEAPVFQMPAFSGTWKMCPRGLAHPHTGQDRPVTFDHRVIEGRDDVVLVHLEHRLVQMCLRLLRAEVWAPDNDKRLHRVTAGIVPDTELDTPAVIGHARLVVIGADRHRLHEEVIRAGGVIRQGRFARLNVGQIDSALERMRHKLPPEPVLREVGGLWPKIEEPLVQALEARKTDRMQYLASTLERRRDRDIGDITRILEELKSTVEAELARELEPEQLQMWADSEREQFRRNLNSLRARVEAIPGETDQETEVIRRRYANPDARLFPVALTFLVPESLCR
jgi:superfamily II DNA or RNA helicase